MTPVPDPSHIHTWFFKNKKTVLISALISLLIRLFFFSIPGLNELLQHRFEFATSLTSYPRLLNCLFTSQHVSTPPTSPPAPLTPYASDVCTLPIPSIILAQLLVTLSNDPKVQQLLFFLIIFVSDLTVAICLSNLINYYQVFKIPIPKSFKAFQVVKNLESGLSQELQSLSSPLTVPELIPTTLMPVIQENGLNTGQTQISHDNPDGDAESAANSTQNELAAQAIPNTDSVADDRQSILNNNNNNNNSAISQRSTTSTLSTASFLSTASTITQTELKNEIIEASVDFNSWSFLLFAGYLVNPITLLSALSMNQSHIPIALQSLIVYTVAMGKIDVFSIFLCSIVNGLVILYDPMYIFAIPSTILLVTYRARNEKFTKNVSPTNTTASSSFHEPSLAAASTTSPASAATETTPASATPTLTTTSGHKSNDTNRKLQNHTTNDEKQPPTKPLLTNSSPNSPLSTPLYVSTIYLPPIITSYLFGIMIEQHWSNNLSKPLPHIISTLVSNPSSFFLRSWYILFAHLDTRPNLGVLWYFFIQIFTRFRLFYSIIIPLPLFSHTFSFLFRLQKYPLFIISATLTLTTTLFHPSPTFQSYIFAFALLFTNYPLFSPKLARIALFTFVGAHTCVLAIVMWHSWIDLGSGNVNFVFVQSITWNIAVLLTVLEIISAVRKLQSIPPEYQTDNYTPK